MNLKQFEYVLVLAQEGSFSRAADRLNISQPSLSQYVKKIERKIGLELFDRANGDVRLTDAGQVYIETGRKVLDLEHQMEGKFADLKTFRTGSIIVGTAPYRAAGMLPVVAASFQKLHPGMHLIVREGTTSDLIEGMSRGEYDLCLTLLPLDTVFFDYEKVMEEELLLAVPSNSPLFADEPSSKDKRGVVGVQELNGKNMVVLTEGQYMQRQLEQLLAAFNITIRVTAVVKSLEAQIEFVKAGVGMALVPSGIERFCSHQEVTFYSFSEELPKREVVVIWRKDRELSRTTIELKNLILNMSW